MKAGFDDCHTCELVRRYRDKWKMIDRKPHKKCNCCGEFLPLGRFYKRNVKKPGGIVYECTGGTCKMCLSEKRKKRNAILKDSK